MANIAANANPPAPAGDTETPIQHLVVIFDENVSFDHYFATYPNAANPPNEPTFTAKADTPAVLGLSGPMLTENPNCLAANNCNDGTDSYNPQRLDRSQPVTCDNNHDYTPEQTAYNDGQANQFPENTGCTNGQGVYDQSIVMDYYDGNTVTALWNYAQTYTLNDYQFGTTYGPSTPGALNVISGLGGPAYVYSTSSAPTDTATLPAPGATSSTNVAGTIADGQLIGDIDPTYDDCSYSQDGSTSTAGFAPGVLNVGNLLNTAGVTWGWFQGGFTPTVAYNSATGAPAQCGQSEAQVGGTIEAAYSPHHEPFQYFASTANPHHLPPSSVSMIGYTDQANHQYDISSFWQAADAGNLPAVSYLKAPRYQDGHPSNSDPQDEQTWLVNTINQLMNLPTWSSTAIVIDWDDSDGWYDSVIPPTVSPSSGPNDDLNGAGVCGQGTSSLGVDNRCGYGPRIPLLVISPYAKSNYVDNTLASQTSIVSFIEYNWNLAATTPGLLGPESFDTMAGSILNAFNFNQFTGFSNDQLFLNPSTGEPVHNGPGNGQGGFQNNGVPNLTTTSTCTDVDDNPDVCATENDFAMGQAASSSGDTVWLSASADITPRESTAGTTLHFTGQQINLQLKGSNTGIPMTIPAPNSEVVFSSSATSATTTYTGGQWVTTVPLGFTGDVFIGGVAYQPPVGVNLAGAKVDWTGVFSGTTVSFTLTWQWAGALYSALGTGTLGSTAYYNSLGIKPIDASTGSSFANNDAAGTPESFKADYVSSLTMGSGPQPPGQGPGGQGPPGQQGQTTQFTGDYNQAGDAYYQAYLLNE